MATITITLKPFQPMEADLNGFRGQGCSEIADLLAEMGETVERKQKREFYQIVVGAAARQQGAVRVGDQGRKR